MAAFTPEQIAYFEAHANDTRVPEIIIAAASSLTISYTSVALRLLARRKVGQPLQSDDWLIIAAVAIDTIFKADVLLSVRFGFGKHALFESSAEGYAITAFLSELLWLYTAAPVKFSILCLYNRIFQSRALFKWSIIIATIIILYSIACSVALGLQVIPFQSQWTGEPVKWEANINAIIGCIAALDVLTDVMIIASPVPQIQKLNLPKKRKVELIGVFGIGAIVIVFGIVRTFFVSASPPSDASWNDVNCSMWSLIEPSVGILSACLPCLRPLLPESMGGVSTNKKSASHAPAVYDAYGEASGKRKGPYYEMFSQGKDGWTDEESGTKSLAQSESRAIQPPNREASPEDGIRVNQDISITHDTTG